MKPKFTEIVVEGEPEWRMPKMYLCFVYAPEGNFLVKGQNHETIKKLIKSRFPICLYRTTFWKNKKDRGYWSANHPDFSIMIDERLSPSWRNNGQAKKSNKNTVSFYSRRNRNTTPVTFTCRRLPNKWIPEYDDAIKLLREVEATTEKNAVRY
ncbi:MAG: hypothetical protein WC441_05205 [Patescibacteria group bacterium]